MSDYQAFQVELNGNIAHVQINRPEKVNAMNAAFWTEIIEIFQWVDETDAVRVVVIASPGTCGFTGVGVVGMVDGGWVGGQRAAQRWRTWTPALGATPYISGA